MNSNATTGGGPVSKIGDAITFTSVVNLLESVERKRPGKEKNGEIEKFIIKCRKYFQSIHGTLNSDAAGGDSLFPVIRLLLLDKDRERAAYNMKAPTLGKILGEILGLDNQDREKLTKYKKQLTAYDSTGGDFASVLHSVMTARFSANQSSGLSLTALHEILDKLARSEDNQTNQKAQKGILLELFSVRKLSPLEGKWLCRILLRNLEYGVQSHMIFKFIHPQARAMYDRMSNLKKVCETLNDPEAVVDVGEIKLFYYVKPMLCLRVNTLDDFGANENGPDPLLPQPRSSNSWSYKNAGTDPDQPKHMAPPFIIETKWDGERFQIHYDGQVLKYLSKRGFNFTKAFDLTITPRLRPQINTGVQSFIIDGEMMAWRKREKMFTQKGADIDVKTLLPTNKTHVPLYVAFDVLFYNGESLVNKPLRERLSILKKILTPLEGTLLVPEHKIIESRGREQVEEALNKAIDDLEEGLVIKSADSTYEPGKRITAWRKVKPEFIYGTSADDMDLLILGAYYSDSTRRGGTIGNFMVGLVNKLGPDQEGFVALSQVGSGRLRMPEMAALVDKLEPYFVKKPFPSVHYKSKLRPDFYIDPKKSIVVSVKASEIIYSPDSSGLNYNLRFPRIIKIREDKNYNDIMTVAEFHTLRESCQGKLAKRTDGKASPVKETSFRKRKSNEKRQPQQQRQRQDDDDEDDDKEDAHTSDDDNEDDDQPTRSKRSRPQFNSNNNNYSTRFGNNRAGSSRSVASTSASSMMSVAAPLRPVIREDIFKNKVFVVYGPAEWKKKTEQDLISHGGQVVQNPVREKFYIVGVSGNLKVETAFKARKYDILNPEWISRCIAKKKEVAFLPSDFVSYTKDTEKLFKNDYDKFGDSYTKPLSLDEAKQLVAKVIKLSAVESLEASRKSKGAAAATAEDHNSDSDDDDTDDESVEAMDAELFRGSDIRIINNYRFFKDVKIAFRGPVNTSLAALVKFYGGKVASDEDDDADETATDMITHVIVENPDSPRKRNQLCAILVRPKWILDCVKARTCLDEMSYSTGLC